MKTNRKRTHTFTLVLSGVSDLTDAVADALFEAGCDDALVGSRGGIVFLDFDREAKSKMDAILSAIAQVEASGINARVLRVEPDDFVTMAEIARRTGRTRENIRQLVSGMRGPGGFPPPTAGLKLKSPVWRWIDVQQWFAALEPQRNGRNAARRNPESGASAAALKINAMLDLRRLETSAAELERLYQILAKRRRRRSRRGSTSS